MCELYIKLYKNCDLALPTYVYTCMCVSVLYVWIALNKVFTMFIQLVVAYLL